MIERAWCFDCHRMRDVEDRFIEDTGDSRVIVEEYSVLLLSCDHSVQRLVRTYRSPLQQAGMPPAFNAPDPFQGEDR